MKVKDTKDGSYMRGIQYYIVFFVLYVVVIGFVFSARYSFAKFDKHDASSYISHAFTLGLDQDLDYSNEVSFLINGDVNAARTSPSQPVGTGILASPFVAAFSIVDRLNNDPVLTDRTNYLGSWSYFGFAFASAFYFLLGIALYQRALRQWLNPFFTTIACLSSGGFIYAIHHFAMSHSYEFFALGLFLYATNRLFESNRPRGCAVAIILMIASSALTLLIRWANIGYLSVPLMLCLSRYVVSRDGRFLTKRNIEALIIAYLSIGVSLLIVSLFYFVNYGLLWPKVGYFYTNSRYRDVDTADLLLQLPSLLKSIPSLLLSSEFGIVYTFPIFPIATLAAFGLWVRNVKEETLVWTGWLLSFGWCVGIPLALVLIWRTTASGYGYRYLLPALPALLVGAALFWNVRQIEARYGRDTRPEGVLILATASFFVLAFISLFAQAGFAKLPGFELKPQINVFGVQHTNSGRGYMDAVFASLFSMDAWRELLRQSLFHGVMRTTTETRADPSLLTQFRIIFLALPTLGAIFSLALQLPDKRKWAMISGVALLAILPFYVLITAAHIQYRTFTTFNFGYPAADYFVGKGFSKEAPGILASWIIANPAELHGQLPSSQHIVISGRIYNPHPDQSVEIAVGGRVVGRWNVPVGYSEAALTAELLPQEVGAKTVIQFRADKIADPKGDSQNRLGVMFEWIGVEPATSSWPSTGRG